MRPRADIETLCSTISDWAARLPGARAAVQQDVVCDGTRRKRDVVRE